MEKRASTGQDSGLLLLHLLPPLPPPVSPPRPVLEAIRPTGLARSIWAGGAGQPWGTGRPCVPAVAGKGTEVDTRPPGSAPGLVTAPPPTRAEWDGDAYTPMTAGRGLPARRCTPMPDMRGRGRGPEGGSGGEGRFERAAPSYRPEALSTRECDLLAFIRICGAQEGSNHARDDQRGQFPGWLRAGELPPWAGDLFKRWQKQAARGWGPQQQERQTSRGPYEARKTVRPRLRCCPGLCRGKKRRRGGVRPCSR